MFVCLLESANMWTSPHYIQFDSIIREDIIKKYDVLKPKVRGNNTLKCNPEKQTYLANIHHMNRVFLTQWQFSSHQAGVFISGMACTHIHVHIYKSFPSMSLFCAYWFLHWTIGMWTSELFLFQKSGKQENILLNLSFTQKLLLRWGWMSMPTKGKIRFGATFWMDYTSALITSLRYVSIISC